MTTQTASAHTNHAARSAFRVISIKSDVIQGYQGGLVYE